MAVPKVQMPWYYSLEHHCGLQRTTNGRGAYLALLGQYMGEDYRAVLLKKAETTLANIRFDGRSKNWTFDRFISKLRESFIDLGPNDQLSERRKVNKLMSAWQVPALMHVDTTIQATPQYREDFDASVNFLANQLATLTTKNGPNNRTVAYTSTESSGDKPRDSKRSGGKWQNPKKKNKSQVPAKKNTAAKFTKKNPGAYIPSKEWKKLTDEQKEAARTARSADGIPSRSLRTITRTLARTTIGHQEPMDVDDHESMDTDDEKSVNTQDSPRVGAFTQILPPPADNPTMPPPLPRTLLVAPKVRQLVTTQRVATYAQTPAQS